MTNVLRFSAVCLAAILSNGSAAMAQVVTVPTDLVAGSQYRLVFVTSGERDATSSNIADYNTFVTQQANMSPALASLGATWTAIASTATVAARDNTQTVPGTDGAGIPIYRLDPGNNRIADNYADLWDGSINGDAIDYTQDGTFVFFDDFAWTGTNADGTPAANEALGTSGDVRLGTMSQVTPDRWLNWGTRNDGGASAEMFYALSDVLMVPVAIPEPTTFASGGILLLLGSFCGRRRRRREAAA